MYCPACEVSDPVEATEKQTVAGGVVVLACRHCETVLGGGPL